MTEPRIVRCRYSQDPHPLDDECVNVTAAWTDEQLEADLRRVAAAVDPAPALAWSSPAANPLADIRELVARAADAPYVPLNLIFSPGAARLYEREMAKIRFRDEVARRRVRAKRLSPVYAAYRRRARRRRL
jgi:hypothetical protein